MKKLEEVKLSVWAKENNIEYKKAHKLYEDGSLPVKTKKTDTGRIVVLREAKASLNINENDGKFATPSLANMEISIASTRRNKAATSVETDQYFQIRQGLSPYSLKCRGKDNNGDIDITDAIRLTQLAYYNFSSFRSTIDCMTEFSTNKIFLRGGSKKSQDFFYNWLESINHLDFQDRFFRECYRSSNIFIHKLDTVLKNDDIKQLNKAFGSQIEATKSVKIPAQYIILNPADINVAGNILFGHGNYHKTLNGYELAVLKNGKTPEAKGMLEALPSEIQKKIKDGVSSIDIPLDPNSTYAIFYKKQDYEPFAVPMAYPVLKMINMKAEMLKIDLSVSRVMNNVVLLINMGYLSKNDEYMFDTKAAEAMNSLFASETVGRTLVADFATKVEHKIPAVGDFLDPKKYQIVNEDIKAGLNSIISGGGGDTKFANQYIQVQLFIQRLQQTRELFLTKFLIPEMKRIAEVLNFKGVVPKPYFEDIDLKDTSEFDRIVAQLYQYGLLTPEETLDSLETGRIPTGEESLLSQEKFREYKDKGYYEPVMGGPKTQLSLQETQLKQQSKMQDKQLEHNDKMKTKDLKFQAENPPPAPVGIKSPAGKPPGGNKNKMKQRKSSPMKANLDESNEDSEELYSLSKIKDNMILCAELKNEIKNQLLAKYNIKELNKQQDEVAEGIRELIMANESNWTDKDIIKRYIENPINTNEPRLIEIDNIAISHGISPFLASILAISKK